MLHWEGGSEALLTEIKRLSHVFVNLYHFQVEIWAIPKSATASVELHHKIEDFIALGQNSKNGPKIVYYGGNAKTDKNSEVFWAK
jgi:hypothetical protein